MQGGKLLVVFCLNKTDFMISRLLIVVQAVVISIFILTACTKRSGIEEQTSGPFIELVKGFPPDPMPPDSLELDSLRRPECQ
jgi:hypothetical protein